MSTIFKEDTDIDITELFDFETPCDDEPCDNAAEWILRTACCGFVILACDPCWLKTKAWVEANEVVGIKFKCTHCETTRIKPTQFFMTPEPLKG